MHDLRDRLRALRPADDAGIAALARDLTRKALTDARALLELTRTGTEHERAVGEQVFGRLGAVGLLPLLDRTREAPPHEPRALVWDVQTLVDLQLDTRSRLIPLLNGALRDTRPIPPPDLPAWVEEPPIPRRVCDEAYLALRRLLAFEPEEDADLEADLFLNLSDEERDAEIDRLRTTKAWTSLVEPALR